MVSSTPRPHFTPGKDPVPIAQEAGWAPEPVWTGGKSRPHQDSIPDRPARSQSLYRLSYPDHTHTHKHTHTHTHIYIYICLHVEYKLFLSNFNKTCNFRHILEKYSNINFHENPSCGGQVVPRGRTDRHDKSNSHLSRLCERA